MTEKADSTSWSGYTEEEAKIILDRFGPVSVGGVIDKPSTRRLVLWMNLCNGGTRTYRVFSNSYVDLVENVMVHISGYVQKIEKEGL